MKFPKLHTIMIAACAVAVTLASVVIAYNFIGSETKIERRVERLHTIDEAQFRHELGVLLGPQFLGGNRHRVLLNGDEIFPAMLGAIRAATATITFESYIY